MPMTRAISPKPKKPKLTTCANRACRNKFEPDPRHPFVVACCEGCTIILMKQHIQKAEAARERKARREAKAQRMADKERLQELKPLKYWRARAKKHLHAYIRARDEGNCCISCDTILIKLGRVGGDYDAGHFRSVGSAKHLEFEENNIHGQCKRCNDRLSGNHAEYERKLIARFGREYVDALYADNEPRHYTADDFQAIEAHYKAKLKALAMSKGES